MKKYLIIRRVGTVRVTHLLAADHDVYLDARYDDSAAVHCAAGRDIPEIQPRYTRDIPEICCAAVLGESCGHVRIAPLLRHNHAMITP